MKTQINAKAVHQITNPSGFRAGGVRSQAARILENRYQRRKIREQLRRLDWALNID